MRSNSGKNSLLRVVSRQGAICNAGFIERNQIRHKLSHSASFSALKSRQFFQHASKMVNWRNRKTPELTRSSMYRIISAGTDM